MMDCAGYEKELVRLLSGEVEAAERASVLDALRRHAEGCVACASDGALLDWTADRKGPLEPEEDPGEAYWDSFEARLTQKLDTQGKPERSGRTSRWPWLAMAAALTFGLIGAALIFETLRQPSEQAAIEPSTAPEAPHGLLAEATLAQEQLQRQLEESGGIESEGELGSLEALEQDAEMEVQTAGWIPDVSELDDAAQIEMLRWLEERI